MDERTLDMGVPGPAHPARQTWVGLTLSGLLLVSFGVSEFAALWAWRPGGHAWLLAPLVVAWLTWLHVGLFIVAHDCMHGAVAPRLPRLHRPLGHVCVALYAALDFDALVIKHGAHHACPASERDPDYRPEGAHRLFLWYLHFLGGYASGRQLAVLACTFHVSALLGAPLLNLCLFWSLPALLSSLQLFVFGTYLPHRPDAQQPFADANRARSNAYPVWLSLLTCFHFGYHHEHHLHPCVPWWRLPAVRQGKYRVVARLRDLG